MEKFEWHERPEFTYVQVADVIAARIKAGRYAGQLPGERDLAAEFGVSYGTVRHSAEVLRGRGLVITRQGRGTFVARSYR
jgi:DNA-binding GntR family transcriptional regulator